MLSFLFIGLTASLMCGNIECEVNEGVLTLRGTGVFKAPAEAPFDTLTIPKDVTIGDKAFSDLANLKLKSLTLNNSIDIKDETLKGIDTIDSLIIAGECRFTSGARPFNGIFIKKLKITSQAVTFLPENVFTGCYSVTDFELAAGDVPLTTTTFKGLDGVNRLVLGGKTKMNEQNTNNILGPMAKKVSEITINCDIEKIPDDFLSNLESLKTLYFGPKKGALSGMMLEKSTKLSSITFSNGGSIEDGDSQFEKFNGFISVSFFRPITIPKNAFKNSALQSISFQSNGIVVLEGAFSNCHDIESVSLPATAQIYSQSKLRNLLDDSSIQIHPLAFQDSGVRNVQFFPSTDKTPPNIQVSKVFGSKLEAVIFQDGIEDAKSPLLDGCGEISVKIPSTFKVIQPTLFTNCESVAADISRRNEYIMKSEDGAFYNKEGTKIMAIVPQTTKVDVRSGVTDIPADVFKNHKKLEDVTIPSSVTKIESGSFTGCAELKSFAYQGQSKIEEKIFDNGSKVKVSVTKEYKGDSFAGISVSDHTAPVDGNNNNGSGTNSDGSGKNSDGSGTNSDGSRNNESSSENNSNSGKKANKAGVIAGSVIGVVAVIAIIAGVSFFIIRRKKFESDS